MSGTEYTTDGVSGMVLWYRSGMAKKILVVLGHPHTGSYGNALAEAYVQGAQGAGAEVRYVRLADLSFDPILHKGYHEIQTLEPDLQKLQEDITWAQHLVFVYPTWWGSPPALLTGCIDRICLPGFGFRYHKDSLLWDKLLRGRSARLITTMDAPSLYYHLVYRAPGDHKMKHAVLHFCGVRPVRITHVDRLRFRSAAWRERTRTRMEKLGARDAR